MDYTMMNLVMDLLSGLALFLFGMKYMSDSLQQAAGQKLRGILNRCTTNKYKAVVFGALFTAFIQSSGATTVMEVGFVNAGIMTLGQSVGITFGANIGTTNIPVSIIKAYGSGTIYYIYWFSRINVRKETIT